MESVRTTTLLSAAAELEQIADNFENWSNKEHAKFIAPNAFNSAKVEDWINTYLSKQRLVAVFFSHPHISYNADSGLTQFLISTESKQFSLIIDVFRLHLPAIATSLKELYDEFWEDVAYHIKWYERIKGFYQKDNPTSDLVGETIESVCWAPTFFLDEVVTTLVGRIRHIVEMTRENLAAGPEQGNKPQEKDGHVKTDISDYRKFTKVPVLKLIKYDEGHTLEFKETLEYDTQNKGKNKDILLSSLKTIAGFLNAEGGTLLIGVDDSGKIKGIHRDLSIMRHRNNDKFQQNIRNFLRAHFEPQPFGNIDISFERLEEGTVCRVDVQASEDIIHLDNEVYVREGNTTPRLFGRALTDWSQKRKRT